jgi:hypothetical protein
MARARALSEILVRRARQDPVFRAALEQWHRQALALDAVAGDANNTVSGGHVHGPVVQGRDFFGITFNGPAGDDGGH